MSGLGLQGWQWARVRPGAADGRLLSKASCRSRCLMETDAADNKNTRRGNRWTEESKRVEDGQNFHHRPHRPADKFHPIKFQLPSFPKHTLHTLYKMDVKTESNIFGEIFSLNCSSESTVCDVINKHWVSDHTRSQVLAPPSGARSNQSITFSRKLQTEG